MDAYDTQSSCLKQISYGSSPCFNIGICRVGYTDKGFRCKCPLGFTGVYCEEGTRRQNCKVESIPKDNQRAFRGMKTCVVCLFLFCFVFFFNVACSFYFKDGIGRWEKTGRAFVYQPTFGDNPVVRKRESAQLQGYWWVWGAEKRPKESDLAGWQHPDRADVPLRTLTSP